MNYLDWTLIGLAGASALWGLMRGLVREVLSLAGWMASFWLAQRYAVQVGAWIPMDTDSGTARQLLGFVLVWVGVLVVCTMLSILLKKLASAVGLGPLDRLLGAVFGALRGLFLLLSLTIVVGLSPWRSEDIWQTSVVPQWLRGTLVALRPLLPTEFGKYLN